MPALNFKKQFANKIISGEKRQTIRANRKDGRDPKAGQPLMLYTGMRTKSCVKLMDAVCVSADPINIFQVSREGKVILGDSYQELDRNQIGALARADGFESISDFFDFFKNTHGLPFLGWLIKW